MSIAIRHPAHPGAAGGSTSLPTEIKAGRMLIRRPTPSEVLGPGINGKVKVLDGPFVEAKESSAATDLRIPQQGRGRGVRWVEFMQLHTT